MKRLSYHIRIRAIIFALFIALIASVPALMWAEVYATDAAESGALNELSGDDNEGSEDLIDEPDDSATAGEGEFEEASDANNTPGDAEDSDIEKTEEVGDPTNPAGDTDKAMLDMAEENKKELEKLRGAEDGSRDVVPTGVFADSLPALLLVLAALVIAVLFIAISFRRLE